MIRIRKAYPTDSYRLIQVKDMVWKDEFYDVLPNGILSELIRNVDDRVRHLKDQIVENNRILVAMDGEKVVGFIFYAKANNEFYNAAAEIRAIYILSEYQKKGIGTQLFEKAVEEVQRLGFHSLIVCCPVLGSGNAFFQKIGGDKREVVSDTIYGYNVDVDLFYFDLDKRGEGIVDDWNLLYQKAQDNLFLLDDTNREIAVVMTVDQHIYMGLGIHGAVCPLMSAVSNMYLGQEKKIAKILILNRSSSPVLPCGRCRDVLIKLGQKDALVLFDMGSLQTMTISELNPYYKKDE